MRGLVPAAMVSRCVRRPARAGPGVLSGRIIATENPCHENRQQRSGETMHRRFFGGNVGRFDYPTRRLPLSMALIQFAATQAGHNQGNARQQAYSPGVEGVRPLLRRPVATGTAPLHVEGWQPRVHEAGNRAVDRCANETAHIHGVRDPVSLVGRRIGLA